MSGHIPAVSTPWPGLALATAGAIAFFGEAIIVKLAYRYDVDAVTLIMYRMLFALPSLVLLLAWWADVASQLFHRLAVVGAAAHGRVQAEPPPSCRRRRKHVQMPGSCRWRATPDGRDRRGRMTVAKRPGLDVS